MTITSQYWAKGKKPVENGKKWTEFATMRLKREKNVFDSWMLISEMKKYFDKRKISNRDNQPKILILTRRYFQSILNDMSRGSNRMLTQEYIYIYKSGRGLPALFYVLGAATTCDLLELCVYAIKLCSQIM